MSRPLLGADGERLFAELEVDATEHRWSRSEGGLRPEVDDLGAETRTDLAEAWATDALYEHAAVAANARLSLELMALGAPPELVGGATEAGLDAVRHARVCFELASVYAGREVTVGPLPASGLAAATRSPAELAEAIAQEGAIAESLAFIEVTERHGLARDRAVKEALALIGPNDERHAELAWHMLGWLLEVDPQPVAEALVQTFENASIEFRLPSARSESFTVAHEEHGRIDARRAVTVLEYGLREVVMPRAQSLLAGRVS